MAGEGGLDADSRDAAVVVGWYLYYQCCEIIASLVVRRFGLDPQRCVFIEHYPRELLVHSHSPLERREGRHKYVTFTWDGGIASSPQWKPFTKIELQALQLMLEESAPNSQE
jgi:hypothetical protein